MPFPQYPDSEKGKVLHILIFAVCDVLVVVMLLIERNDRGGKEGCVRGACKRERSCRFGGRDGGLRIGGTIRLRCLFFLPTRRSLIERRSEASRVGGEILDKREDILILIKDGKGGRWWV